MKTKLIAIIIAIAAMVAMPLITFGQEQDSVVSEVSTEKAYYNDDFNMHNNEISVSVGTISGFGAFFDFFKVLFEGIGNGLSKKNTDTKFIGTYGIDYYYQVNPWFRPGAKFVYEGLTTTVTDTTGAVVNHYNTSTISFLASVQFSYLNRKYVKLYSGIDLGLTLIGDNNKQNSNPGNALFGFNLTVIGIRVGNDRIFGLVETNFGMDALIKAGLGVRF